MKPINRDTVLEALRSHIGRNRGVSARELVVEIVGLMFAEPRDERELRNVIVELRLEGMHIGAHPSDGYYMCANADELNESCLFLYDRAMTSLQQISAMKNVAAPDLKGQLKLPT